MEDKDIQTELVIKLSEALDGHDMDDVIPTLACLLARVGSTVCSDKEVFAGYVMSVIDHEYDNEGETLQ